MHPTVTVLVMAKPAEAVFLLVTLSEERRQEEPMHDESSVFSLQNSPQQVYTTVACAPLCASHRSAPVCQDTDGLTFFQFFLPSHDMQSRQSAASFFAVHSFYVVIDWHLFPVASGRGVVS